ncbi:transposase, partial [Enterococcus cecorum]|uniref:transposase n=1 Tax=Enterococcus cecorum TaxID=44008 RepID=UPI001FADCD80
GGGGEGVGRGGRRAMEEWRGRRGSGKNALKLPYSNGKLEGKNNLIKVLQRVSFGFRNFGNMRRRIFLYEEKWQTKKPKKRKCRRKTA